MKRHPKKEASVLTLIRCAVYTRKSTEEGLEQEFNSLDAQREAGEAFIKSQASEGWTCLPDRYDDGGWSGGNMERPALQRLMADIEAGKIDCVVVYKVDRLSRSLLDFAAMMQTFEKHKVSFVSVTQQFNTATSMGRLILNVLLSFAQFEREIISERTRDKIAATRRKGKWAGGHPILGYDVDPQGFRLVVNADEAERVRAIFKLYLQHESLLPVVQELERRGWLNKRWTTRKGHERGGKAFTKTSLYKLLTNVAYVGKVRYKDEVHDGEHAAIVDPAIWQRVQALLERNGRTGGAPVRNKFGALLKGIIRCVPCECAMTPSHTTREGTKRYRYYVCSSAQKRGWHTCPSKSVPAAQIEQLVVNQIKCIGQDRALLQQVLEQARQQDAARAAELEAEQRGLEKDLKHWHGELRKLSAQIRPGDDNGSLTARLADLQERIGVVEGRMRKIREQIHVIHHQLLHEDEAAQVMAIFDPVWGSLTPHEQVRAVHLLVERVDYDGSKGKVSITFRPSGIKTLARELANQGKERIAMTTALTIECDIHFDRKGRGSRKVLENGPRPHRPTEPGRVPRVARLMALAIRFEQMLRDGVVESYTELGALGHVTRARVSQIMNLLNLAPDIQEALLHLPRTVQGRDPIILRQLQPIASVPAWQKQRRMWRELQQASYS